MRLTGNGSGFLPGNYALVEPGLPRLMRDRPLQLVFVRAVAAQIWSETQYADVTFPDHVAEVREQRRAILVTHAGKRSRRVEGGPIVDA